MTNNFVGEGEKRESSSSKVYIGKWSELQGVIWQV